ncbi:recombinase family protein [Mesorhizobium sp. M0907]
MLRDATIAHVHHILHNPAYAGAYVYGRRRINAVRQGPGSHRATSKVQLILNLRYLTSR